MIASPLTVTFYDKDNSEVHKLFKPLTKGIYAWKYIDKCRGGCQAIQSFHKHYNGAAEGERGMNVTNDDITELYFKRDGVFPFEKYVNCLKECYNTLEEIGHMEFEAQKVQALLNHIIIRINR